MRRKSLKQVKVIYQVNVILNFPLIELGEPTGGASSTGVDGWAEVVRRLRSSILEPIHLTLRLDLQMEMLSG